MRKAGVVEKCVPLMKQGICAVDAVLSQTPAPVEGRERASFLNDLGYVLGEMGDQLRDADQVHKAGQWLREAMRLMGEPDVSDLAGQICDSLGFVLMVHAELEGNKAIAAEANALLGQSLAIFEQLKSADQAQTVREHLARLRPSL